MRIDFTSEESVEITGPADTYQETVFEINLRCTVNSSPGSFNPYDGGFPPEAAEFEFVSVSLPVKRVNKREGQSEYEAPLTFTWAQFEALVGKDVAESLYDKAYESAVDSGQF